MKRDGKQFSVTASEAVAALSRLTTIIYPHPGTPSPSVTLTYRAARCPVCDDHAFEVTTHGDSEPRYLCWTCEAGKRPATELTERLTMTQEEYFNAYVDRMKYAVGASFDRGRVVCPLCHEGRIQRVRAPHYWTCPVCVPQPAATGPTQRLTRLCNACNAALPTGAAYCIACGARVEEAME